MARRFVSYSLGKVDREVAIPVSEAVRSSSSESGSAWPKYGRMLWLVQADLATTG
jgi:hypothetical protein